MVEIRNSVNIFVGKPEGKLPLGRSGRRQENIKQQKLIKLWHMEQYVYTRKLKCTIIKILKLQCQRK
jgi:hypothetical protein